MYLRVYIIMYWIKIHTLTYIIDQDEEESAIAKQRLSGAVTRLMRQPSVVSGMPILTPNAQFRYSYIYIVRDIWCMLMCVAHRNKKWEHILYVLCWSCDMINTTTSVVSDTYPHSTWELMMFNIPIFFFVSHNYVELWGRDFV